MSRDQGGSTILKKLAGTWKLVSYRVISSSGKRTYPLGRDARGVLAYDERGNMSGQLMSAHRTRYTSGDMRRGTPNEISSAMKGYLAYFGTYELNVREGYLVHHVEGSLFPNWIGTEQRRYFRFVGDRMSLSATFELDGRIQTAILTWKRPRKKRSGKR